tara:strand:+ start:842 stop:1012 length:171 start_codon:yes stop_codon:yes gene_type:complete
MKRHQFNFEFLGATSLLGLSISQHETKLEESDEWHPTFNISIGLIFVTFSYSLISL